MKPIHTYSQVNKTDPVKTFGISRMEDIYAKHKGKPDLPHRHDYYTILLVQEARGKHVIDFLTYTLAEKQAYFISPGQVHQLHEAQASQGFSMVFSSDFLVKNNIPFSFIENLNLFRDYGESPPLNLKENQLQTLGGYCEEIYRYYESQEKFKYRAIAALLELFLIHCNNICQLPFDNTHMLDAGNSILRSFKALVEQRFKSWHTSSAYAAHLSITPDHLNRTIKSLIGKTAKEYIQSRITIAAKRMLYFSALSTKEIAYELGFSEPANFSAFFKKCTGYSPSQFKKQI